MKLKDYPSAEPPTEVEWKFRAHMLAESACWRPADRSSLRHFVEENFPDRTAELMSVFALFGSEKGDFKIGSKAGFAGSPHPREWYVEVCLGGAMVIRIWPYGQYVGCRSDGVYHVADVMPRSEDGGDGFIIHFLSDGTIKAARTYEGG